MKILINTNKSEDIYSRQQSYNYLDNTKSDLDKMFNKIKNS